MQLRATSAVEREQQLTRVGGVDSSVTSQRAVLAERAASLEHEMKSIVQQGRLHASLGALSAKASQLAAQAATEQSILKRARVESKLAELNLMRRQIIAQLSSDKKHAERMAILRKAIARDPHNQKLLKRLRHDEAEEQDAGQGGGREEEQLKSVLRVLV